MSVLVNCGAGVFSPEIPLPIAAFLFPEGSGSTTDGDSVTGTIVGATWASGRVGQALQFAAQTDRVDAGSWDVSGDQITIAAWVWADDFISPYSDGRIISKAIGANEADHYWMLSTILGVPATPGPWLRFRLKTGGTTTTLIANVTPLQLNQWHHVVGVYNGATMQLYVDGVDNGSTAKTGTIDSAAADVYIGTNPVSYTSYDQTWRGKLDSVRVWNTALTVAQLNALRTHESPAQSNTVPTVDAGGNDTATVDVAINLSGTANDDGLPDPPGALVTTWSKQSGPGVVTFGNVNALSTTASFDATGAYTLQLEADDSELQATDTVDITVVANQAPTVDAGANDEATLDVPLAISGTANDDGLPNPPGTLTTTWSKQSGPGNVVFGDASALSTTATFDATGAYVLQLEADDSSLQATDTVSITVIDPPPPTGGGHYVSTTGTPGGDGTIGDPWDIDTVFAHPAALQPGDTVWLRGGIYRHTVGMTSRISNISGTASNRIVVRSYPGEQAIIDFYDNVTQPGPYFLGLTINGNYVDYRNITIRNSSPYVRFISNPDHDEGYGLVGRGQINMYGTNNRLINCRLHDMNGGVGFWQQAIGGEIYGCLIFNNGWDTPTSQWDHAIYTQNNNQAIKFFRENLMFNQFGSGGHAYAGVGPLDKMTFEGNVMFQNSYAPGGSAGGDPGYFLRANFLIGGTPVINDLVMRENYTYSSNFDNDDEIGYRFGTAANGSATVTDNYFYSGETYFRTFSPLTSSGNQTRAVDGTSTGPSTGWTVNASPTGTVIDVRPNVYESGRGHIIIYNWDDLASVNVDISSIVANGASYNIYHVYDLDTPVLSGTYSGGTVAIPMADTSPPTILGDLTGLGTPINLPREFGAFLVTSS